MASFCSFTSTLDVFKKIAMKVKRTIICRILDSALFLVQGKLMYATFY
jgi:hypothetical protein